MQKAEGAGENPTRFRLSILRSAFFILPLMNSFKIAVLAGDGIGPEVMAEALRVLEKIGGKFSLQFSFNENCVGGAAG
jgi:hypothetical protein